MMRLATFCACLLVVLAGPAVGDPKPKPEPEAHATKDGFFTELRRVQQGRRTAPGGTQDTPKAGSKIKANPHVTDGACVGADRMSVKVVQTPAGPKFIYCAREKKPGTVTVGMVRTAFAALKLPGSTLTIQPPDGLTLVNFETNFYTDDIGAISKAVTLLGQRVTIEATPSLFTWHFDDGYIDETTSPGAPYPDLIVTHKYVRKTTYRPSLSTTYSGRFKVGNGPWRDIPGTVRVDGPQQRLRTIEASPKLVGYGSP